MSLDDRADAFDRKIANDSVNGSVVALIRDARIRRRQIIILAILLIIDIALTIGFAWLSVQAHNIALNIQKNNDTIIYNCKTGNDFRATEAALWSHILAITPIDQESLTPTQLAQRQKTITDFQQYLKTVFAPRDCNNIIQK